MEIKIDGALEFMMRFVNGYRIVSTGDLTLQQISEASIEGRLFVDPTSSYGWVALPWSLTTDKDRSREFSFFQKLK